MSMDMEFRDGNCYWAGTDVEVTPEGARAAGFNVRFEKPVTTREEWEVSGNPPGYPAYRFVFGNPNESDKTGTPEERARNFIAATGDWEFVTMRKRTITETDWEVVP